MDEDCKITKAEYFNDYKLLITFSDQVTNVFDFKNLVTSDRKEYMPYLDITKFKKFKIQRKLNCIAWGKEIDMQVPGYILHSRKKSTIGWYKDETTAELKKRLPKKHYYEMFVDNCIWAGILVVLELLEGDKSVDLFAKKFNTGADKNYIFEVYSKEFVIKITLQKFGLVYELRVKNIGSVSYKVSFEKDVIGPDLKGEKLEKYDALFDKVSKLIKKDRMSLKTKFSVLK